ncbi:hypothetical protein QQ045_006381 [Rhodiola kirilowii]
MVAKYGNTTSVGGPSASGAKRLNDLGAPRVIVTGTEPIGCIPSEIAQRGRNGECAVVLQQAAEIGLHFWDAFHPSDRANQLIVDQFMIGSNKAMNLSTILALDSRT